MKTARAGAAGSCLWGIVVATALGGCVAPESVRPDSTGSTTAPPAEPVPRPEPRSRYGNGPVYEVFGKRYEVLETSLDFRERGVASWYGPKFHGRPTASREPYDMHAMTAAHKSLPLPTYVKVRNLKNNRSVIVRVNDRGPFVDNRIIDLSYAAASKLDMVRDGTTLVEVSAISFDEPTRDASTAEPSRDSARAEISPAAAQPPARVFVQVGAFGDRQNAARRHGLLKRHGINSAFVDEERRGQRSLYRVRVGPIDGVAHYDEIVARLSALGISESHLVTSD